MKHKFLSALILAIILPRTLHSGEYIGLGIHAGFHNDVGNMGQQGNSVIYAGQFNGILGVSAKIDRDPLFIRTGADRSMVLMDGEVKDNSSGELKKTRISYTSIPLYAGINFRIRERGKFYMGMGPVYLLGNGSVHTIDEKVQIRDKIYCLGFITGVQLRVDNYIQVYAEWEYISARSAPKINTDPGQTWKDYSIDYSGHRLHLGFSYFIL